jgi:hypothetical protein
MIIRIYASGLIGIFNTADNRSQKISHGPQADHGRQPTKLIFKPYFLWLLVKNRIIIKKAAHQKRPLF